MIVDGGDGTLTPTTLAGGTTITFNDVGDGVVLVYGTAGWVVVGNNYTNNSVIINLVVGLRPHINFKEIKNGK